MSCPAPTITRTLGGWVGGPSASRWSEHDLMFGVLFVVSVANQLLCYSYPCLTTYSRNSVGTFALLSPPLLRTLVAKVTSRSSFMDSCVQTFWSVFAGRQAPGAPEGAQRHTDRVPESVSLDSISTYRVWASQSRQSTCTRRPLRQVPTVC